MNRRGLLLALGLLAWAAAAHAISDLGHVKMTSSALQLSGTVTCTDSVTFQAASGKAVSIAAASSSTISVRAPNGSSSVLTLQVDASDPTATDELHVVGEQLRFTDVAGVNEVILGALGSGIVLDASGTGTVSLSVGGLIDLSGTDVSIAADGTCTVAATTWTVTDPLGEDGNVAPVASQSINLNGTRHDVTDVTVAERWLGEDESGSTFTNQGAAASVRLVLRSAMPVGTVYHVLVADTDGIVVAVEDPTTETLRIGAVVTDATGSLSNATVGSTLYAITRATSTTWVALAGAGAAWAAD